MDVVLGSVSSEEADGKIALSEITGEATRRRSLSAREVSRPSDAVQEIKAGVLSVFQTDIQLTGT